MSVAVGIGRNVRGVPLSPVLWAEFQGEVVCAVQHTFGPYCLVFQGTGLGLDVVTGGAEDSAVFVADPGERLRKVVSLRPLLRGLAVKYGQESIALTVGETEFVGA